MQAYIKNNKLIVNDMIQSNEIEDFKIFINKAISKGVQPKPLYDIEGKISGIEFKVKKEE